MPTTGMCYSASFFREHQSLLSLTTFPPFTFGGEGGEVRMSYDFRLPTTVNSLKNT